MDTQVEPTRDDVLAVLTFSRRFDDDDFVAGEWVPAQRHEDGVLVLGFWLPSEDVAAWETALYERHIVLVFDWSAATWSRQMRRYFENPDLLERARLLTARKVLTTLSRANRFCEGYLAGAFEAGVPQAAMRRLEQLTERVG